MTTRRIITALLLALASPLAVEAQSAGKKVPRIGVLTFATGSPADPSLDAFRQGLRDLGYVEGQNLAMEYRYLQGRTDRAPEMVAELIELKVDLIVAAGPTAVAAKKATQTIPIVFIATGEPVFYGLVTSLARPGGNATGLALIIDEGFHGKWMALLKEAAPAIPQVGDLFDAHMGLSGPNLAGLQGGRRPKVEAVIVQPVRQVGRHGEVRSERVSGDSADPRAT